MARFFLFDAMSIVFRAYYAMAKSPMRSGTGEPTGAVFGFMNILTSVLAKENPEYVCIAFDTAAPTFRHTQFEAYKANRQVFPEPLVPQLLRIKEFIACLNIKQIEAPGFEADDIIGTLARLADEQDVEVYCVTPDKDYCQLVNEGIKIYRPTSKEGIYEIVDADKVIEKFGVPPLQVIDVLGLIGDSSDNVPGVKGVGEKTAIPLIQKYGSIEEVYNHLDEIPNASLRTKLIENKDIAFLSKQLVTIDTHVPLSFDMNEFTHAHPNLEALGNLFDTLGFRRMREKFGIPGQTPPRTQEAQSNLVPEDPSLEFNFALEATAGTKTIRDIHHNYILVNSRKQLDEMVQSLQKASLIAFDTESDSLDSMTCNLVGISLCAEEGTAYYIPLYAVDCDFTDITTHAPSTSEGQLEKPDKQGSLFDEELITAPPGKRHNPELARMILDSLRCILENPSIGKCGQNAKFDALILKRYGINVTPIVFDTMLASYVLNPISQHGMDALARQWLSYSPISITTLIGEKKKDQRTMDEVEVSIVAEYAAEDADVTLRLRNVLCEQLRKEGLLEFAETVEFPLVEALTTMESNGIAIDTKVLGEISELITEQVKGLKDKIYAITGEEFNIDSPKQLGEILFERMKIPTVKKTKTGYSTDVSVLEELADTHPIARLVLEYRQLTKLRSTYVDALPRMVNPHTNRIHTTFNQTVASTGRLSSTDPNLQNIPIRSELGKQIRRTFVAQAHGASILSADYSQIELRIMAHVCGDETLIHAFHHNLDIHAATASNLFGVPVDQVNGDMRRIAKTVNFGVMYGLGAFGLAQRLGISRSEAQNTIINYFNKYPGIKEYIDSTIEQARQRGYVETLSGRRKYFPDITSGNRTIRTAAERAAINMPIQGTAADMMKLAMINIHREMNQRRMRSLMMLQVHDELVFEMMPEETEQLPDLVKSLMESAMPLQKVPILVEVGIGKNWGEAH